MQSGVRTAVATLAACVLGGLLPAAAAAAWNQPVGGASPINHAANQGGFVANLTSIGGVPHVAWTEFDGTNFEIRASRLNAAGTAWDQVVGGANPINQSPNLNADGPTLASIGGVPYVAWHEVDGIEGNLEIRVSRLNGAGTAWEQVVGGASPINNDPTRNASQASLAEIGGVPYVAWTENDGTNGEIRVSRLNVAGTAWEQPEGGASPINEHPNGTAANPSLASVGGVPHVAWEEVASDGNREIRVSRLNAAGTDWQQVVGGASPINQSTSFSALEPSLTAIGGVPYVAWREFDGTNFELRATRLNGAGTAWEQIVGGASPINEAPGLSAFNPSLTSIAGVPYVSWYENDGANAEVRVSRLNGAGTAWEQVVGGASPINESPSQNGFNPSLASIGGVPYVAWNESDGANDEIRVTRLEPEFLGASAAANSTSATLTADVKTYGLEYEVGFEHGQGLASSTSTATTSGAFDTITRELEGLDPSTAVDFRPFATAGLAQPRVLGTTQQFTTDAASGPGPVGPPGAPGRQGPAGPPGPPGEDALVTCKVKGKRGKPKVKCKVTFAEPASSASVKLVRRGRVYARGHAADGDTSLRLRARRELRRGRYRLVIVTVDAAGERHESRQPFVIG